MCDLTKLSTDQLIGAYIKTRDAKKALEAEQKEALRPYNEALEKLESRMLAVLQEQGVESMRSKYGTCYQTTRRSVRTADREAFMDYVKANQAFDLLDVRPNKTAVEEFVADHGDLPPGISSETMMAVGFRRA